MNIITTIPGEMDIQWEANDCTTPNATADLNERVYGQDRDHIKKHW